MINFLVILLALVSIFLVLVILVQRGRGGGLAGAFGSGGGSSSAFGTKTGDVFTTLTVITFVVFIVLSITLAFQYKFKSPPNPAQMTALADEDVDLNSVVLKWTDEADNEKGYRIRRAGGKQFDFVQVGKDLPPDSVTFKDTGLEAGTDYIYRVVVFNDAGERETANFAVKTKGVAPKPATLPTIIAPETAASGTAPAATSTKPATGSAPAATAATTAAASTPPAASTSAPATTTAPATTPKP